ncbi:methyltransferase domain-containing protein [Streptomyces sp. 891-h]|uniref:SAM-dependent methyltransferase n=1 Tax=Streptomyces sp. 891-h TaxID=2720714 RepID=UPI001FAADD9B|nr:methyltransferase domain-containing protein [Streptomyces sp. 891-h]UNZ21273.1 methyltransferase domain-containing protein [Streptomyces sp. 891-h]
MIQNGEDVEGEVEELYDAASMVFAELYGADLHFGYWDDSVSDLPTAAARMTQRLIESSVVAPGQHVLDLGCGTGTPALRLAQARGVRVTGVSISRHEVDRANESSRRRKMTHRVRFEHADGMALPYADASFDAAWAIECMSHMPDRAVALGELARVVRPGGRVLIADGYLRGSQSSLGSSTMDAVCTAFRMGLPPTLPRYTDLLTDAGFSVVEQEDLSQHAARSMTCLAQLMEARAAQLTDVFGEEALTRLSETLNGADPTETVGYVVLSAERR